MAKQTLNAVRKLIGFPNKHWKILCLPLIQGLNDDELEILRKILVVRQSFYLPIGAEAENIYRDRDVWTYAVLVVAINKMGYSFDIPDIGKAWLEGNEECWNNVALAQTIGGTGVIHHIIKQILDEDKPIKEEIVQTGQESQALKTKSIGLLFIEWLINQLNDEHVVISKRGSILHAVEEGFIIVSPNAFKKFSMDGWMDVRDSFVKLDVFVNEPCEKTWSISNTQGVFIKGYLIEYTALSGMTCDITINYDLNEELV